MRFVVLWIAGGLAAVAAAACVRSSPSTPEILLESNTTAIVTGLSPRDLAALRESTRTPGDWHAIMRVTVARDGATTQPDIPAVAGRYTVIDRGLVFTPTFGFDPGRRYAVTYNGPDGSHLTRVLSLPAATREPSTVVTHLYPSGDVVPENQLRLYVQFSGPMGMKGGLPYMRLLDADGREVREPFLPVDAEFWNADRTRFTMFFDPGRVKRGILPNEQMGRPMIAGRTYTLVVSRDWPDAHGLPLKEEVRRTFRAGPADMKPLDPKAWRIHPPAAGSRDPLTVAFPEPLDHGLLLRALGAASGDGRPLEGDAAIDMNETRWTFTPRDAWRSGEHRLIVLTILEDLAGNRIGRAFEVDRFERIDRSADEEKITIPFRIP